MKLIPYPRRSRAVDFLRGLSILIVMLLHARVGGAAYSPPVIVPAAWLTAAANNGILGVCAFFVISGYVITAFALRRDGDFRRIDLGRFYRFRASRIFPPLLGLIALNLACRHFGCWGFGLNGIGLGRLVGALFTFRFNRLYLAGGALLPAWAMLWSLSVEETFYLVFPLFGRLLRAPWLIALALAAIVIQGPFSRHAEGWGGLYSYFGCFDLLALGCLVAMASRRWAAQTWCWPVRRALQATGLILFTTVCVGTDIKQAGGVIWIPSVVGLGAALFLLGSPLDNFSRVASPGVTPFAEGDASEGDRVLGRKAPGEASPSANGVTPALSSRWTALAWPVCFLGFLSYELYLFYAPILLLLRLPLQALARATGGFMPKDLTVAILIGFCAVICGLLHTWVNERVLRWARGRPRPGAAALTSAPA